MTSGTKNNSMTSFYLFSDYDVILPMTPHPYKVAIPFLDYEVIIFDDVNSLGYCDVTVSLCPWRRTPSRWCDYFIFRLWCHHFWWRQPLRVLWRHCVPVSLAQNRPFPTTNRHTYKLIHMTNQKHQKQWQTHKVNASPVDWHLLIKFVKNTFLKGILYSFQLCWQAQTLTNGFMHSLAKQYTRSS